MQVDRGGNILTNFFSNFLRQFKNPTKTGLGRLLDKLLAIKIEESEKKPAQKPEKSLDIMGSVKTVFRYVNNNNRDNLTPSERIILDSVQTSHLILALRPSRVKTRN